MQSGELNEAQAAAKRLELRQIPAEILCTLGWIYATLHVPPQQPLPEFLGQAGASVNLTRVRLPREPDPLGFVALRRETISVVAPPLGGSHLVSLGHGATVTRDIACLLGDSMLRGRVEVPAGLRLSDFLRQGGPFLTVRRGMLAPYGATLQSPTTKTLEIAFVNIAHVAGISEAA